MTRLDLPLFYNDLGLTISHISTIFVDGVNNRKSAAHHPVVGTIDEDGRPSQRVMILRECNWPASMLRLHTDQRSTKISQISNNDNMSILIYDEPARLQIRLSGKSCVGTKESAQSAWDASTEFARRCYMTISAPGEESGAPTSGLPAWIEGKKPTEEMLGTAQDNFATLLFTFDTIDWLYLAHRGHRRAKFIRDIQTNAWNGKWLIP
jgi:pyridoxamine 5'-phosphate oxidase